MNEPTPIEPERFFEFIHAPGLAVLLLSLHPVHAFNPALHRRLSEEFGDTVAFGTVDLATLLIAGGDVLPFLNRSLRGLKGPRTVGVLPGYCLFREGELIAWDSGLPAFTDMKGLAPSALLGAVFSGLARDWGYVRQAVQLAAEELTAQRVTGAFRRAARRKPSSRRRPPPPASSQELHWAYQVLGLPDGAPEEQVQEAWRKLRIENHPDLAGQDPVEFQRRSRISADINRARDLILKRRGRKG